MLSTNGRLVLVVTKIDYLGNAVPAVLVCSASPFFHHRSSVDCRMNGLHFCTALQDTVAAKDALVRTLSTRFSFVGATQTAESQIKDSSDTLHNRHLESKRFIGSHGTQERLGPTSR